MENKWYITDIRRETRGNFCFMAFRLHKGAESLTMHIYMIKGSSWERKVYVSPAYGPGDSLFYIDAPWGVVESFISHTERMVERMNRTGKYEHFYNVRRS